MNDQKDIDSINKHLYSLEFPVDPIYKIMFYFNIIHNVIDYQFPANYLNYENPYFQTYLEMKKFLSVANSLSPEFLHINNAIIYYNNKKFYHDEKLKNIHKYEFKVINPNEASSPKFNQNYKNNFNISNINCHQKDFEVEINENIQFPHSEDSYSANPEDYYYEEGLEDNYQVEKESSISSIKRSNSKYQNYREKYNEQIIEDQNKSKSHIINPPNSEEEEEEMNELSENSKVIEKVNIINKLVISKECIDIIYNEPMKKSIKNMKAVLTNDDEVRLKSVSMPKNVFFYFIIGLVIILISCSSVLINAATTLMGDQRFKDLNRDNSKSSIQKVDCLLESQENQSNETVIVPCKSCYNRLMNGNKMAIVSGSFAIFFIVFIFFMYVFISCEQKKKLNKKKKKNKKKKEKKKKSYKGLNMIHIIVLTLLIIVALIITLVAEILIGIGLTVKQYHFTHSSSVLQIIMNSVDFICYILIILFYFKQ